MAAYLANTKGGWGLVAIALHWSMAAMVFFMFFLGLYMTGLDYMHPWYKKAPWLHKGIGIIVFTMLLFRTFWSIVNVRPEPAPGPAWEHKAAYIVHRLLYLLLYSMVLSGYLISTADGRGVEFFGLFDVPALVSDIEGQEDAAGTVHLILGVSIMCLAVFHALGALKHHFIDKDDTLRRMLGVVSKAG